MFPSCIRAGGKAIGLYNCFNFLKVAAFPISRVLIQVLRVKQSVQNSNHA